MGAALLTILLVVAWSGTLSEGLGTGPSWSGLRGALALALVSLGIIYRETGRINPTRSSLLLSRGAFISGVLAIAVPTALIHADAGLAGSELALIGSVVALGCFVAGGRARQGKLPTRGVPEASGYLLVGIILVTWVIVTTLPLPSAAQGVLDIFSALVWAGVAVNIFAIGFSADDEVVSGLGLACLGIAAAQLLAVGGARSFSTELIALAGVSLAITTAYLELIGAMGAQRAELEATREQMKDLAHEARTAITAIEGTLVGLDRSDLLAEDADALEKALHLELQSLRLMLTRDQPQLVEDIRLDNVLPPIVAASRQSGAASLRWLAPTDTEVRFAKGALVEIIRALIDNGLTHSGESKVGVEVALASSGVEISVVDQGRGVDPWVEPYLFDRGVKRRGSPGKGLGLNIARNLARSHGGELEYRQNPDGGSRFVLTVPSSQRVIDLTIYEDHQFVELPDGDGTAPQTAPPNGHRREPRFARKPHGHWGPQPGGKVPGV